MNKKQADNCLTLAYCLADCMDDEEFEVFWESPGCWLNAYEHLFHTGDALWFGEPGRFVLSGDLTRGLGVSCVTAPAIATALVAVCDFSGWEAVVCSVI